MHQESHPQELNPNPLFNTHCHDCGGLCLYADDSTYTLSNCDVKQLKVDIDAKYKVIADYMNKNKLILNSDKITYW